MGTQTVTAPLRPRTIGGDVWIVEDEPPVADLAADVCAAAGVKARVFRSHRPYLAALEAARPAVVILDWRLETQLSAGVFMATRHRLPHVPVIYWTGATFDALPAMIRDDPAAVVVDKAAGLAAFEAALAWALRPSRA